MTSSQLVAPAIVAVLTVSLNAIVNVKLRFAADERSAWKKLRALALTGAVWIATGITAVQFLLFPFSSAPITRATIATFVVQGCTLTFVLMMSMIGRVIDLIRHVIDANGETITHLFELQGKHATITDALVKTMAHEGRPNVREGTDSGAA